MTKTPISPDSEGQPTMAREAIGNRMSKRTAQRRRRRRVEIARGQRLAMAATVAAIVFFASFLVVTIGDFRYGYREDLTRYVSVTTIVTVLSLIGIGLAIAAYRGHAVLRPLYLTLTILGGIAGLVYLAIRYIGETAAMWNLLDLVGVAIAFFVAWVFFLSVRAHKFFAEQAMTVKRK